MSVDGAALISAIASWIGVILYGYLGFRLAQRRVSADARIPAAQFSLFWLGLGGVTAIGAIESLIAAFQVPPLALVVTLLYLEVLGLCVVLWGLVGYLVYLFTGRSLLVPLAVIYSVIYVLLVYFVTASVPTAVTVTQGSVGVTLSSQVTGPIVGVLLLALLGPEIIGAILYFTLFFRTRDPTIRYRVTLVSWSLIVWLGLGSIVNVAAALGGGLAAQILGRSIGVFAALVILLAFYPPAIIRRRLSVRGVDDVAPVPTMYSG
ncbi:MAG: hypothetical protein L3J91_00045 [Thermoplasmata archaeon]|nr:hypothetical protein [Thermoplasmata archaeon]